MNNQVKVSLTQLYKDSQTEAIVCNGKLMLICDQRYLPEIGMLGWSKTNGYFICKQKFTKDQKDLHEICVVLPVIFSPLETIEPSDRWINTINPILGVQLATAEDIKHISGNDIIHCRKVLAVTENLSTKHLQAIVDGKLRDGDEVFVACCISLPAQDGTDAYEYFVAHNGYSQITLFNSKHKVFSSEEKLKQLASLLQESGIRKYTCTSGWGYSQIERDIVDLLQDNRKVEFAKSLIENFDARWEMFQATPQDLIGKTVISIRAGFASATAGRIMVIDTADEHNIHLIQPPGSTSASELAPLGWGCKFSDKHNSFIFVK